MMRPVLILLAALLLTACNAVVSEKPLFGAADARGAPPLKPGLWAMVENEACAFDPANPPAQWPECADPIVFDGRVMRDPKGEKDPLAYIFAKGDPRILQFAMPDENGSGKIALYFYLAVKPEPGRGPVTSARAWLVQCGPQPEGRPADGNELTDRPLPGLTIKDEACLATRPGPLRNAAKESLAWGKPMRLHWMGPVPPLAPAP